MNTSMCPTDGATMTNFQRSGVPLRVCPTCQATFLPAGGLDEIIARERQAGGQSGYPDPRGGKHGGKRGMGGFFGGGGHH